MSSGQPDHPSGERLAAFAAGRVGNGELEAIARHLGECAACRRWLEEAPAADPFLRRLRDAVRQRGGEDT
jgi:anti-sigma factor ChrR (cupin superfamily)